MGKVRLMFFLDAIFFAFGGFHVSLKVLEWIKDFSERQILTTISIGIALGAIKYVFILLKFNDRNYQRIKNNYATLPFWKIFILKDFLIILLMISFGIVLRVVLKIPELYLTPVYSAISFALGASFFQYIYYIFKKI